MMHQFSQWLLILSFDFFTFMVWSCCEEDDHDANKEAYLYILAHDVDRWVDLWTNGLRLYGKTSVEIIDGLMVFGKTHYMEKQNLCTQPQQRRKWMKEFMYPTPTASKMNDDDSRRFFMLLNMLVAFTLYLFDEVHIVDRLGCTGTSRSFGSLTYLSMRHPKEDESISRQSPYADECWWFTKIFYSFKHVCFYYISIWWSTSCWLTELYWHFMLLRLIDLLEHGTSKRRSSWFLDKAPMLPKL